MTRSDLEKNLFYGPKHLARLRTVRPGPYSQITMRLWYAQLLEEHRRHVLVIMLAGVNYRLF